MSGRFRALSLVGLIALAAPCWSALPPGPSAGERLDAVLEQYLEGLFELNPILATQMGDHRFDDRLPDLVSADSLRRQRELYESCLEGVHGIDPALLDEERRITWQILESEARLGLEGLRFPFHLLPVSDAAGSLPISLPTLCEEDGLQPFDTIADHQAFVARLRELSPWVDRAIASMREGMERGVVQPRSSIERVLPVLREHATVVEPADSLFYGPALRLSKKVPVNDRRLLQAEYLRAIRHELTPAYARLLHFLEREYLPACRTTIGLGALPDGASWYRHLIRELTTTELEPEAIMAIGVEESHRTMDEMARLIASSGLGDSPQDFLTAMFRNDSQVIHTPAQLLRGYRDIGKRVDKGLPKLFWSTPSTPLEVRVADDARRAAVTAAHYQGPRAGVDRPGVFYLTQVGLPRPRAGMEALYLHEAVPGHHFQISLARENQDLPPFRRYLYQGAYIEGWALYAEGLGTDLGLYQDPFQEFGRLRSKLLRSARLIADVAIHHLGLGRAEVEVLLEQHALGIGSWEIDRYISWPAQALCYTLGERKLYELRRRAEAALGDRFDVRDFHRELLRHGALPLWLLDERIDAWLASAAPPPAPTPEH